MAQRKSSSTKKAAPAPAAEEEEVDYGATADEFFNKFQDEDEPEATTDDKGENMENDDEDEDDDEDNDANEAEEEEKQASDDHASNDNSEEDDGNGEEEGDSDEDDDDDEQEMANRAAAAASGGAEGCSFDLRNLTAVNSHPLAESLLFNKKKASKKEDTALTIGTFNDLNDEYLLQKATEGATQLIEALWQLPTQRSDAGPLMTLPTYSVLEIPRALPPPPPKVETRWEKFAKERGLPLNKEKRSRKVWDEASQTWKFRHGYEKANAPDGDGGGSSHKWPIMEVGPNDDPYADPWEQERDAKHKKSEKNRENQLKNQERAGRLAKGTTTRIIKSRDVVRKIGKEGGRKDNQSVLPVGVPVDMTKQTLRGKPSLTAALKATQASTASLGRFDKMREGEPERKFPQSKKKRKLTAAAVDGAGASRVGEQERGMKVLNQVLNGGGVAKEKARKKGKLAKGVTAYDYEYDDGADKAIFNKKKGRGGMGKNKKMTKKRIK